MTTPTRERIVQAGGELFRQQGFAATGVKQLVSTAQAPFGSVYHFFPGGKQELAAEVLRTGGAYFLNLYLSIVVRAPDMPTAVSRFFAGAATTLRDTDFADACPIATVASEVASTNDDLRAVCEEVFETWLAAMVGDLVGAGLTRRQARPLALNLLSLIEGAFLLSRTSRSAAPMNAAGRAARVLVQTALAG